MSLVGFKGQNHPQQTGKRGPRPEVDDRATAPEVFGPLHDRFAFTLDACALPHNAKLRRYFAPADLPAHAGRCMWAHIDECGPRGCEGCEHGRLGPLARDGLAQSWKGERVWCNPPYSSIEPWVVKALTSGSELVVMLLPANRTEQGWWQNHIEPLRDRSIECGYCGSSEQPVPPVRVEFLRGRMRFIAADALEIKPNERPPFGVCLLIIGNEERDRRAA